MNELPEVCIDYRYTNLLKINHENATALIRVSMTTNRLEIKIAVRQGDTIVPQLFNLASEGAFRQIDGSP